MKTIYLYHHPLPPVIGLRGDLAAAGVAVQLPEQEPVVHPALLHNQCKGQNLRLEKKTHHILYLYVLSMMA